MRSSSVAIAVAITMVLAAGKAAASTDINGLFDARSMGMGSTGVAFLDSPGVLALNPAALDGIKELALSLDIYLIVAQPQAPYTVTHVDGSGQMYSNYETIRSEPTAAPLPFIGGAFRLHERVVFGAGIYPMVGQGTQARYQPAPELRPDLWIENQAALGLIEVGNALSVRLLDNLSFAAMYRITYMTQTVSTPLPGRALGGTILDPDGNPVYGNIDVSGLNFAGFQLGVLWKPVPTLGLGFSYRNKVTMEGEGTTDSKNPLNGEPVSVPTIMEFPTPHNFRVGLAWTTLQEKLLLAAEFKYLMYAEAFETLKTTTTRNGMTSTTETPTHWKDAYNVYLGAEYTLSKLLRLRGGYIMATSATPEEYAKQFMAPPGVSHCGTAGIGFKLLEDLNVDLAAAYVVLQSEIDTATPDNSGVGTYASHGYELSLSAMYHL